MSKHAEGGGIPHNQVIRHIKCKQNEVDLTEYT